MIGRLTPEELADFAEFAQVRQRHLMRTAYLLSGNKQAAQDLTQTALLNLCRAWRRACRADDVDAYAHRVLINAYLSTQRKAHRERKALWDKAREAAFEQTPDAGPGTDLRLTLLAALDRLTPKSRGPTSAPGTSRREAVSSIPRPRCGPTG